MTSSMPVLKASTSSISVIRPGRRNVKSIVIAALIALALIVIVGLIVLQIVFTAQDARREADALAQEALRPKRINAVPYEDNIAPLAPVVVEDSSTVDFSLFSSPSQAAVYRNNEWIGNTPIEQIKLKRSFEEEEWLIVLDGYELERFNMALDNNYSKVFTLAQKAAAGAHHLANIEQSDGPQPIQVDVGGKLKTSDTRSGKKKSRPSTTGVLDTGVALPD